MFSLQLKNIMIEVLLFIIICLNSILLGKTFLERAKLTPGRVLVHLAAFAVFVMSVIFTKENLHYTYIVSGLTIVIANLIFKGKASYKLWVYIVMSDVLYTYNLFENEVIKWMFSIGSLSNHEVWLVIESINTLLILLLTRILQEMVFYRKIREEDMSLKENLIISMGALIYLFIIGTTDYVVEKGSSMMTQSVFPLLALYIVTIGGAWCILMGHYSIKTVYEEEENKLQRKYFKRHLKTYTKINKSDKEQERLKQEASAGVSDLIRQVGNDKLEEIKPLIEEMETKMRACKPYIVTGNTMLDMLINEKYDRACKHNIEMKVNISLPEKIGMGTVDLCMLLNNTLDYALDKCSHIAEEREKSISVEGVWYKGYLMFKFYYSTPAEQTGRKESNSNKLIKQAIAQDPYGMGTVMKHIRRYEGEVNLQECGWGEEKLTFSLNAAKKYSKAFGY